MYKHIHCLLYTTPLCVSSIDRTLKMYIGGSQKRPDAPYARPVMNPDGKVVGQVSEGYDRLEIVIPSVFLSKPIMNVSYNLKPRYSS